jgi:tripartite-type tricarboxylate transporter receptor subunit TctC
MPAITRLCLMVAALGIAVVDSSASWAKNEYPNRPIELVVGYPPGGAGEFAATLIADQLAAALGQPVNVEYRPGASGVIGARAVAHAAPDGYSLLLGQTPEIAISPHLVKDLGYDPKKDLQPVALVIDMPIALVAGSTASYANVKDLVDAARSSSRGLTFSTAGPGTAGHFAGELLRLRSQIRLNHIPNDGAGPALKDVLDGRVDFCLVPLAAALPHVQSNEVKILAVSSADRSLALPNVPTIAEAGFRDFRIVAWVGVFAPKNTPDSIRKRLNQEINEIMARPEIRQRAFDNGALIRPMSPNQFRDFVIAEIQKYADIVEEDFCSRYGYGGCLGYSVFN